jgi:23S rRNA pseudouridine2605 synthase
MEERLQKILAGAGIGSRRACEELIKAGRVRVNKAVAEIGQKADPAKDKITVDGRIVKSPEQKIHIALNKPKFYLSTVEPEPGDTRPTVCDLIPLVERLYPVGRLDFESEGLILMTNDGDLAQKLQHPRYEHEKEYRVLVARHPDQEQLSAWRRGVVLEDGYKTRPADVRAESESGKGMWLRVTLKEGHKRQIREMGMKTGLPVVRIIRVRMGTLHLGNLKPKEWRPLTPQEVLALKSDVPPQPSRLLHGKRKKDVSNKTRVIKPK